MIEYVFIKFKFQKHPYAEESMAITMVTNAIILRSNFQTLVYREQTNVPVIINILRLPLTYNSLWQYLI